MKKLFIYCAALCLLISCRKKELPQEEYAERVFYINCNIDGQATKLEAGNNDYYMNTSCGRDSDVYFFRGDLAQTTYVNGRDYAISVIISDYKVTAASTLVNVDSVLLVGNHLYNTQVIPDKQQKVSFVPLKPNDGAASFIWSITDGKSDQRSSTAYSITETLDVSKTYTVTLDYNNGQGSCASVHRNEFKIGNRLQTTVTAKRDSSNLSEQRYRLSYTLPQGQAPYSCKWTFADGSTSTNPMPTSLFQQGLKQIVKLDFYNGMGDTCVSYYQLDPVNGEPCHANYVASFQPVKNTTIFSTVKILLTDKEGKVYSSGQMIQPEGSYFTIENSSPYKSNDHGHSTRSVKIKFKCLVGDGNKTISLDNGEGVIAVAHQ